MTDLSEESFQALRAVRNLTERNAKLPQAESDEEFVPGATYRDLRRELSVTWPAVREIVQAMRVHAVLEVARFYGRFGPVFVLSEYGSNVLDAKDAGLPPPAVPEEVQQALDAARELRAKWDAEHPQT